MDGWDSEDKDQLKLSFSRSIVCCIMYDAYSMYSSKFVCMIIKIDKALTKTKFE